MATELKKCPCGREADFETKEIQRESETLGNWHNIKKYRACCGCGMQTVWYSTPEAAAKTWNRRDKEEELGKYLVELWDTVEEAHKIIEAEWNNLPKDIDVRSEHPANAWMMNWYLTMETIPIYRFKEFKEAERERD